MQPDRRTTALSRRHKRSRGLLVGLLAGGAILSATALGWMQFSQPAVVLDANGPDSGLALEQSPLQPGQAPEALAEADEEGAAEAAATLDNDGRFTGPGEEWPPAVRGATNRVPVDLGQQGNQRTEDQVAESFDEAAPALDPSEAVLADPAVQEALGDDYGLVAVYSDEASGTAEYLFFSNATNQTVLAYVEDWQFLNADVWPAGEFQPELSEDEKNEAIELARSYWESNGDPRIDQLEGFAILAVRPDDGNYYDTRTAYVNFSVNIDAVPELVAWVDLSTGQVFDGRVER